MLWGTSLSAVSDGFLVIDVFWHATKNNNNQNNARTRQKLVEHHIFGGTYSHLSLNRRQIDTLLGHRHIIEFALLLRQQLEPAVRRRLNYLRDPERYWAHEIVARCPIPIPDFNQQATIFVLRLQFTNNNDSIDSIDTILGINLQCQRFVPRGI